MLNMQLAATTMDIPIKYLKLKEIKNEIDFWLCYYGSLKDCPFSIVERVIALYNAQAEFNSDDKSTQTGTEDKNKDDIVDRMQKIRKLAEDQEITGGKSTKMKLKRKK